MRLLRFDEIDELDYLIYIKEWEDSGEKIVPMASARAEISFDDFLKRMRERETDKVREKGLVPATLYFFVDEKNREIVLVTLKSEDDFIKLQQAKSILNAPVRLMVLSAPFLEH